MIFTGENILLVGSILLFVSILVGKTGYRFGVPALLLFLGVGMLFGSDGLGLQFHNAKVSANSRLPAIRRGAFREFLSFYLKSFLLFFREKSVFLRRWVSSLVFSCVPSCSPSLTKYVY